MRAATTNWDCTHFCPPLRRKRGRNATRQDWSENIRCYGIVQALEGVSQSEHQRNGCKLQLNSAISLPIVTVQQRAGTNSAVSATNYYIVCSLQESTGRALRDRRASQDSAVRRRGQKEGKSQSAWNLSHDLGTQPALPLMKNLPKLSHLGKVNIGCLILLPWDLNACRHWQSIVIFHRCGFLIISPHSLGFRVKREISKNLRPLNTTL